MSEFVSAYISEDEESRFKRLVIKDLKSGCAPEEQAELEAEPQLWLDELTLVAQDIQAQLSQRKVPFAKTMPSRQYGELQAEYLPWKAAAMRFQTRLLDRRRDVKDRVKKSNVERDHESGHSSIFRQMLEELQAIRALLAGDDHTAEETKV